MEQRTESFFDFHVDGKKKIGAADRWMAPLQIGDGRAGGLVVLGQTYAHRGVFNGAFGLIDYNRDGTANGGAVWSYDVIAPYLDGMSVTGSGQFGSTSSSRQVELLLKCNRSSGVTLNAKGPARLPPHNIAV